MLVWGGASMFVDKSMTRGGAAMLAGLGGCMGHEHEYHRYYGASRYHGEGG